MGKEKKNTVDEIKSSFNLCREKISTYIHELKIISSDEVLNGSIQEAQKILNNILTVENAAKKLLQYQNEFAKVIESVNINGRSTMQQANTGNENDAKKSSQNATENYSSPENFTTRIEFRISILKALIYLGGSASVNEVLAFIAKDMQKKFRKNDLEIPNGNGKKRWEIAVEKERENMEAEGLLNEHSTNGIWEIVQKGIDYLSNHGK